MSTVCDRLLGGECREKKPHPLGQSRSSEVGHLDSMFGEALSLPQSSLLSERVAEATDGDKLEMAAGSQPHLGIRRVGVPVDATLLPDAWRNWFASSDPPSIDSFTT
jgi:hypothetical protein